MTNDATPGEQREDLLDDSNVGSHTRRGTSSAFGRGGEGDGGPASQLMDLVRQATDAVRTSAEQQLPAVERAAHDVSERAKRAAEAAAPHVDRLAQEAATFVRDHQDELKAASVRAARIAARFTMPAALRDAVDQELARDRTRASEAEAVAKPMDDDPNRSPPA